MLNAIDSYEAVLDASGDLGKLVELVESRRKYYEREVLYLTKWLLHGTLILDEYGDIGFLKPADEITLPSVVDLSENPIKGCCTFGGSQYTLPKPNCVCPCCGKEITLDDVYNRNFHIIGNEVVHSGECVRFQNNLESALVISKDMISMAKRIFGRIENVCTQQGNNAENEFIKISFKTADCKYNIIVFMGGCGLRISYEKGNESGILLQTNHYCGCCLSSVE